MRSSYEPIVAACEALGKKAIEHVENYGYGIEGRLTGLHETAPWNEFSYGVSDRGASVRIPWQVEVDGKGYIEDRRPNANMDPYVVTRLITDTVCGRARWMSAESPGHEVAHASCVGNSLSALNSLPEEGLLRGGPPAMCSSRCRRRRRGRRRQVL
jgi:hypothetical protein